MFLVSNILNNYFSFRLKNKSFRMQCYKQAVEHKLRNGKLNNILLRNLNDVMADNTAYHDEFCELLYGKNFQQAFWESDLGYLWYLGNLKSQNVYFNTAIKKIETEKLASLLDVGCGWGEFPDKVSKLQSIKKATGIDISKTIINEAKKLHQQSKANFEYKDILDVTEKFDIITLFGSTDYITPETIYNTLEKIIQLAKKQILIVNSLRKIPFHEALNLSQSIEIKRYDIGYVHPLKHYLEKLKLKYSFLYTVEKAGQDSILITIDL